MHMTVRREENSWGSHFRATLALGIPLIGAQLAQLGIHTTDVVILGRLGATHLAAIVLAGQFFFTLFIFGSGFATAVIPMVAQAYGRGDVVSVVSVPFAPTAITAPESQKTDIIRMVQTVQRPLLGVLGLALIAVVALLSLKSLKVPAASAAQPPLALPHAEPATAMSAPAPVIPIPQPTIPLVMPTNTMRDKANSSIEQQPDAAVRVVRAWLREG